MGYKTPKTHPLRIARCRRATEVMQLRVEGLTHREIGERLGFSEQRAFKICQEELDRLNAIRAETAEEVRRLEVERLDELLKVFLPKAKAGDNAAAGRVLDIMARRSKLLGLDLADKEEPGGPARTVINVQPVIVTRESLNDARQEQQKLVEAGD